MRGLGWAVPLGLSLALFSAASSSARISGSDARASHAYLEAEGVKLREEAASFRGALEAMIALDKRTEAECGSLLSAAPKPAKGTPPSTAQFEMSLEIIFITFTTPERTERATYERFERVVRRLRWSNHPLTRLIHEDALEKDEQARIDVPVLCTDVRAWAASGYKEVPEDTKRLVRRMDAVSSITKLPVEGLEHVNGNVPEIIAYGLKRYEDASDHRLARRLKLLEAQLRAREIAELPPALKKLVERRRLPHRMPPG